MILTTVTKVKIGLPWGRYMEKCGWFVHRFKKLPLADIVKGVNIFSFLVE